MSYMSICLQVSAQNMEPACMKLGIHILIPTLSLFNNLNFQPI
jgi:hypothetical protein